MSGRQMEQWRARTTTRESEGSEGKSCRNGNGSVCSPAADAKRPDATISVTAGGSHWALTTNTRLIENLAMAGHRHRVSALFGVDCGTVDWWVSLGSLRAGLHRRCTGS